MVFEYVLQLTREYDAARRRRLSSVRSLEDWSQLSAELRERFRRSFGELPVRTPLNPRIVGILERPGYRIEKILFESRPGFFVTANAYVPVADTAGPRRLPAVLSPLGHWDLGKAEPVVQAQCADLALKGVLVLTYDPLGQGERSQYWDVDQEREAVTGGVFQHTRLGNQCVLSGNPLASFVVWDGIRALDYLASRADVDPERIACTGASGGGLQTLFLAVLDERVKVAAPTLYVSSHRRWLETGFVADSEQVGLGWLRDGLDHPELSALVAPRPLLLNAAKNDFFPIKGTRETFAEASRIYRVLGAPDAIALREHEGTHEYGPLLRETMYTWLLQRLGRPRTGAASRVASRSLETPEALRCTPSGQVATLGGTTVFESNRARAEDLSQAYAVTLRRWRGKPDEARRDILNVLAVDAPLEAPVVQVLSSEDRGEYSLTRLVYWTEPAVYVPGFDFVPRAASRAAPAVLLVDGRDSAGHSEDLSLMLVRRGLRVLRIDPRGMGETRWTGATQVGAHDPLLGNEAALTHNAWLLGTNLVGWRVRDVLGGLRCLRERPGVDPARIRLAGIDTGGATLALFAAALDEDVERTALVGPLVSYGSVARTRLYRTPSSLLPWGVLERFDLPQVAAMAARRPLLLVNVVDAAGQPIGATDRATLVKASNETLILQDAQDPLRTLADWLR